MDDGCSPLVSLRSERTIGFEHEIWPHCAEAAGTPLVKVTQTYAEVADSSVARTRVTQTYAEVADVPVTRTRVTQTYAEVAEVGTGKVRATQFYAEIADSTPYPDPVDPTPDVPEEDIVTPAAERDFWTIF